MNLESFLKNLAQMYPPDTREPEKIENIMNEYAMTIKAEQDKCGQEYDFERLFNYVKKDYRFKKLPSIPYILDLAKKCKEIPVIDSRFLGQLVVFVTPKNQIFEFVKVDFDSNMNYLTAEKLKEKGVKVRTFPKGSWINHSGHYALVATSHNNQEFRKVDLNYENMGY